MRLWDWAINTGLMAGGAEVKYHLGLDGTVLSVALGRSGQALADGERLSPSVAEGLREQMPLLAGMVSFYENNQLAGRGLDGAPEDGVMPPAPRARWYAADGESCRRGGAGLDIHPLGDGVHRVGADVAYADVLLDGVQVEDVGQRRGLLGRRCLGCR
ncbi:hypothetical protein [Streptomyces lushanensis]|uniref:hypothetical protein n=1 Tax=Streptomyces lushanensis TaxID=1434255 RepID=UPI001FE0AF90|nr:hypothetical protein [Streptomyces lushanensis]